MSLIDLTQPLEEEIPVFPGDPDVGIEQHASFQENGYRIRSLRLGTHSGTHIDAPSHTERDGESLANYEPDTFEFESRLIDVRNIGARNPIDSVHLPDPESDNAELYVFWTGWSEHWPSEQYYNHPYLAPATARACARREISVAIDALSPDPSFPFRDEQSNEGVEAGVPAHRALLGNGQFIIENLRGLDQLPQRFTLRAQPLSLDAGGSPVRAVADV